MMARVSLAILIGKDGRYPSLTHVLETNLCHNIFRHLPSKKLELCFGLSNLGFPKTISPLMLRSFNLVT
jgi:hypothetical protein